MSPQQTPFFMKKRVIGGGLIGIGILVGSYLNGLFKGLDFGTGAGPMITTSTEGLDSEPEKSSSEPDDLQSETSQVTPDDPEETTPTGTETTPDPAAAPGPAEVLHVLIDDREFFLQKGDGTAGSTLQRVELKPLIEMARQTTGNDVGVRVRISRRESARATTELLLQEELAKAGIAEDEIRWESELVP